MASVTITIPDTLVPRITTAMRALYPQYASLGDAACFKQVTADYWRAVLGNYEADKAFTTQLGQSNSDGSGIG